MSTTGRADEFDAMAEAINNSEDSNVLVSSRRNSTRPRTSRPTSNRNPPGKSNRRTCAIDRTPARDIRNS